MTHFSFAQATLESRAEREGAGVTQGPGTALRSLPRQKGLVWRTESPRAGASLAGGDRWTQSSYTLAQANLPCASVSPSQSCACPWPGPTYLLPGQPCQAVTSFLSCTSSPPFAPQPLSPPSALTVPEARPTRSLPHPCHIQWILVSPYLCWHLGGIEAVDPFWNFIFPCFSPSLGTLFVLLKQLLFINCLDSVRALHHHRYPSLACKKGPRNRWRSLSSRQSGHFSPVPIAAMIRSGFKPKSRGFNRP